MMWNFITFHLRKFRERNAASRKQRPLGKRKAVKGRLMPHVSAVQSAMRCGRLMGGATIWWVGLLSGWWGYKLVGGATNWMLVSLNTGYVLE